MIAHFEGKCKMWGEILVRRGCSATIDIGQKFRKKKREIGKNLIE